MVPFGGYRHVLNWEVTAKLKLCRANGWRKFRDKPDYNNQDLHDQLVATELIQDPNLLFQARTGAGFTHVFAATQNRIYAEVPATGNWRILSDLLGGDPEDCSERVWTAGHVGSIVVFSNNIDKPVYHQIGQPALEDADQSVSLLADLERLNITKVGLVVSWNNFMIYMDVEQDGARERGRIIWSDYKRPLSIYPDKDRSLAGKSDLPNGEIILNAEPLSDRLLLYTTRGIREMFVSGAANVFTIRERYVSDKEGSRCLAYKRTLVSDGSAHYYMGRDGIYKYSLYVTEPELVDYIHRASAAVFDDINAEACNAHCAGFYPAKRQIWFSWARAGETCPGRTLVIGTEFPFSSEIDEGFSAFLNAEPHVNLIIRDFVREHCICTTSELDSNGFGFIKEGGYCTSQAEPDCTTRPQSFHSQTPREEADIGVTTEQWDGDADADSFSALFSTLTVADLCGDEFLAGGCNSTQTFVMASTHDSCLKEAAAVLYREHNTDRAGCGTYSLDGYRSLMTSGALHFNAPEMEKVASWFHIESHPVPAAIPGDITLRMGVAAQAIDPLTAGGRCQIHWSEQNSLRLECLSDLTLAQSQKEHTAPSKNFDWSFYVPGRFIYYEIEITNPRSTPRDTGAGVCISRYDLTARQTSKC